jgi:hypothetical protein
MECFYRLMCPVYPMSIHWIYSMSHRCDYTIDFLFSFPNPLQFNMGRLPTTLVSHTGPLHHPSPGMRKEGFQGHHTIPNSLALAFYVGFSDH